MLAVEAVHNFGGQSATSWGDFSDKKIRVRIWRPFIQELNIFWLRWRSWRENVCSVRKRCASYLRQSSSPI